jgi:O-antigen ligase
MMDNGLTRATRWIDREWCKRFADGFAVALAVALPWSTSATSIFSVLWLIVVIPILDRAQLRRVLALPAGGLPVLFFVLLLIGMLWAVGVPMAERFDGVKSAYKFLFIPLLMAHFSRSERGAWVIIGFLVSCIVLLTLSAMNLLVPAIPPNLISPRGGVGVPVHDYIFQSNEFTVCIFLLAAVALDAWRERRRGFAVALGLLCMAFLIDMFSIVTSRTALVVLPVLVLVFAMRHLSRRGTIAVALAAVAFAGVVGVLAPSVRTSVSDLFSEVRDYDPKAIGTRAGERIEFWTKSIGFIADAPLIGHGTGSIRDQYRRVSVGDNKFTMQTMVAANPHNQTFATAIQLGLIGTVVMYAMWLAHLLLFCRGSGFAAWAGLVIVTQNIVSSLFNSHLFDFAQGWGYVLGVGVAAGVLLKRDTAVKVAPRSG